MADSELDPKSFVQDIIQEAAERRCSDIHIQISPPQADIFLRIDGVLQKMRSVSDKNVIRIGNRVLYLAGLKTYQNDSPQEGRIEGEDADIPGYIRVSTYPTVDGLRIALRLFRNDGGTFSLDSLDLPGHVENDIIEFLGRPAGTMLLTGPSGSGKTTTIYACLQYLQKNGIGHIVTIEDPVEYKLEGVMQTQVRRETGLDFPEALKRLLRQDPEVIVIGEIRDETTAKIAFQAGLTGHKVISTIHAGSAVQVLVRLLEIGLDPYIIASSLKLIIAQRLLRRVCGTCGGSGCDECADTGFAGRVPAAESLTLDSQMKKMIKKNPEEDAIVSFLNDKGFADIKTCADNLQKKGITVQKEIARVIGETYD